MAAWPPSDPRRTPASAARAPRRAQRPARAARRRPGGGAVREPLLHRGDQRPGRDDGREPRDRRTRTSSVRAVRDGGAQRVREEQGLRDDQRRRDHAEPAVRATYRGRLGRAEQARVEWLTAGADEVRRGHLAPRQTGGGGDAVGGEPLAEHPVGPALVEQHQRREERGHPGHDRQGVVGRRRVRDGQRVGRVERGHDVRVHRAEDQHDRRDDRDGGRDERPALAAGACAATTSTTSAPAATTTAAHVHATE